MKKNILSSVIVIISIIAFFLFLGLECNDKKVDPEGKCLYFRSFKIAWKATPVDPLDRPLNPEEHLTKPGGMYYFNYRPSDFIEKVCTKEATFVTVIYQIKEEYYSEFSVSDPTLVHNGKDYYIDWDWNNSTANGINTTEYSITIPGETEVGETTMQLGLNLQMHDQGNHAATIELFNKAVVELVIDWGYTEY